MEAKANGITLELTQEEAVALRRLLGSLSENETRRYVTEAQDKILTDLYALLEKTLADD